MNGPRCHCVVFLLFSIGSYSLVVCAHAQGDDNLREVSMPCADFSRLGLKDQRALLVQVFQRRVEHAGNLSYEVDLSLHVF